LYFLGLEFQYAVASSTIQGLDQDARYLVRAMTKQPVDVLPVRDRSAA
jgi:putative flavoprotein involved in K+ transport